MFSFLKEVFPTISEVRQIKKYGCLQPRCIEDEICVQVATFAVNYIGHPFNQSIRENRPFFYALSSAAIFFTAITSDVFRSLNDWLKLVPLPKPFGHHLLLMAFGMMVSCYLWEHTLRWMFPAKMPISRPRRRLGATNKKIQ